MRDYPHMQKNYARARELMARNGNPTQWGDTFPKDDVVRDDIALFLEVIKSILRCLKK